MTEQDEISTLRREVAELRALVERAGVHSRPDATSDVAALHAPTVSSLVEPATARSSSDRRGFLRVAALAAGGAAAGIALSSDPAAAANGDNMKVGDTTNAATAATGLAVTGTTAAYGIGVTDNGLAAFPSTAAIAGHSKSRFTRGVLGFGTGESSIGVEGQATGNGAGVLGSSTSGVGVQGFGNAQEGIYGVSQSSNGVLGASVSGIGVFGSGETVGVRGEANYGVLGAGQTFGVRGESTNQTGVSGSGGTIGCSGFGPTGVYGESSTDAGAGGSFKSPAGPGAILKGTPSLLMVGRATAPPAQAKAFVAGSVDHGPTGTLWACVADGTPGSWRKLAGPDTAGQFHVLGSSVRIYDSRAGEAPLGVTKGVLGANQERVIDAKVGGGVPAGATAVLVNLTVVSASSGGWLAAFKNGIAWPGNSSLNWDHTGQAIANSAVVAVDTVARFKIRAAQATNVIIDAVGYYQ